MTLFGRVLADSDLPQESVVHIENAVPGDRSGVNVQPGEPIYLCRGEFVRVRLVDPELLEALQHERGKLSLALLCGDKTAVQCLRKK